MLDASRSIDVVVFSANQPIVRPSSLSSVGLVVLPRQHAFDAVSVDGDVVVLVDTGATMQFDLGIRRLIFQELDESLTRMCAP